MFLRKRKREREKERDGVCMCECLSVYVHACVVKRVCFECFFLQVLHFCFSSKARKVNGTRECGKRHPMVSFIFTLVKRRAIQMLCYYPAADALLSCGLLLKATLLKKYSLHFVWWVLKLSPPLSPQCSCLILHNFWCFCIWMQMKHHAPW